MRILVIVLLLFASPAAAQWPAMSAADQLDAGRCVLSESDFRDVVETASILHILVKRATRQGVTVGEMARRYCAVFDRRSYIYGTARLKAIREATWEHGPGPAWSKRWTALRAFMMRFAAGEIVDPTPRATIFAGGMDLEDKQGRSRIPRSWVLIRTFGPQWARTFVWREGNKP
jgi:hypothetical protein